MEATNINHTVGQAIQDFYTKNDFGEDGGVSKKYAWAKFGFLSIPIPNMESRRKNVSLHDVNHIVTGYDTTWKGESAVSAWEVASGGWQKLYIPWLLTLWAMGLGVLFYPKNVLMAFKRGLTMNNALTSGLTKNELFSYPVLHLRNILGNKPKSDRNPYLWMIISFLIFVLPFLIGLAIICILIRFL
jgi:hypothetical protein